MGFLIPVALGLLALAIPIILFYMLRLRRQDVDVSSSFLWRRALQDRTANMPWNKLRRNLLLLLQLLLLLLLVLSLARPFFEATTVATGNMVVILDASASMQAVDEAGGGSRFERARREANALIDGMSGEARMSLVLAGPVPQVVVSASNNKSALRSALAGLSASNGGTDMAQAVTLAAATARQLGEATVVLISDGAFQGAESLPQVRGKSAYINVGQSGRNVAITALSLREATGGPQLFASVTNTSNQPASALLSISIDGNLRDSRQLDLGAGEEQVITLSDLPLDTRVAEGSLQVEGSEANMLVPDDRAWAVLSRPPSSNVLLVSEGNGFLEKSLNLLPGVKLFKTSPGAYTPSESFGLTVLDGVLPSPVPPGNLLVFAPPASPLMVVSGTLAYPAIGQVAVNDPLLRFVDLSGLHIAAAQRIIPPAWARVLVRTPAGDPLILAGETEGRRVAVIAFDLHKSDLPLQVAFPILVANLLDWLQPATSVDAPPTLAAGDPISIRALPEADEIRVTLPEGASTERVVTLRPSGLVSFAGTDGLGVYSVQQFAGGTALTEPEQFAVNMLRDEVDITPHANFPFADTQAAPTAEGEKRPLEIWPWVLAASLLLLALEWWYYNRGGRVVLKRET
ncbi:MAG: BatA and WFA domain-containing protein [Chloroflexota bacterium]|nr:BatA and WFA domain-containing protein [Chloroflexota bacterium]MDQ5867861.1 BatA and WFA domain-containing protein [Chloroflexota bacterium]